MQLDILTPEGRIYSGEVESVILPGLGGKFQILKGHAPLIAALEPGKVKIKASGNAMEYQIKSGICEVINNKISVLTEGIDA